MKRKKSALQKNTQIVSDVQAPEALTAAEAKAAFFTEIERRVLLSKRERRAFIGDFEGALRYYASSGLPFSEALARLDAANLGGFYARPSRLWFPLDNAAKIYPLSMRHGYMMVFRLSVYLKERVVPELLQIALSFTIKRFPSFATTVKKGFFWHYLDATKRRYYIEPESGCPCEPLLIGSSGSQSFRVLYYDKRISVEYFHILTDGSGGMVFLKTLTAEYLRLLGTASRGGDGILSINEPASASETANEFVRAEKTEHSSGFVDKPAAQFGGRLSRIRPCQVLHFKMDAARLRALAKSKGSTVTAYLLALMFVAGRRATDEGEGEFNFQVPVNMRKFYPSDTVRNFSMYCGIRLPLAAITEPDAILPEISRQLTEKTSKEAMSEMMNSTRKMVNMVRYVPLLIKEPVARVAYGFLGGNVFSSTLSNLGVVTMPPELMAYIDSMDFVIGGSPAARADCAMVTVGNTATLSISKKTADPSFEEALYELLTADGLMPEVEGGPIYEG